MRARIGSTCGAPQRQSSGSRGACRGWETGHLEAMRRLSVFGLWVAALAGPLRLAAQEAPAERVLRGLIVDSVSRHPVSGAVMYFDGRRDEFYSGSEGQF